MRVSLTDAKAQLAELVRRAEAGEKVELTRHGQTVATINGVKREPTSQEWEQIREDRRRVLEEISIAVAKKLPPGPDAGQSVDFHFS